MLFSNQCGKEVTCHEPPFKPASAIFQDPVGGNIHWREVETLPYHLGVTIVPTHGARFRVVLNNIEGILHHPHHSSVCTKHDIKQLREYLAHAGISQLLYETEKD